MLQFKIKNLDLTTKHFDSSDKEVPAKDVIREIPGSICRCEQCLASIHTSRHKLWNTKTPFPWEQECESKKKIRLKHVH